jgi:hypothetical protein
MYREIDLEGLQKFLVVEKKALERYLKLLDKAYFEHKYYLDKIYDLKENFYFLKQEAFIVSMIEFKSIKKDYFYYKASLEEIKFIVAAYESKINDIYKNIELLEKKLIEIQTFLSTAKIVLKFERKKDNE